MLQHRFRRVRYDVYLTQFLEYRANCGITHEKYVRENSEELEAGKIDKLIERATVGFSETQTISYDQRKTS